MNDKLDRLRQNIDKIDLQILDLLHERLKYVEQVGELKKQFFTDNSFIRSVREAKMTESLLELNKNIYPPEFIVTIWRNIIVASLHHEKKIAVCYQADSVNAYNFAKEYFGNFIKFTADNNIRNIISKAEKDTGLIGVVEHEDNKYFWKDLLNSEVKIFARLPFFKDKNFKNIYAFSKIKIEFCAQSTCLFILENENITNIIKKYPDAIILDQDQNQYLMQIKYPHYNDFINQLKNINSARIIGAFISYEDKK